MKKKLTELNASFIGAGGPGVWNADGTPAEKREGVGLTCDCPCGCERQLYVPFENPLDGKPQYSSSTPGWKRTGETLETLTLHPSVERVVINGEGCGWHGWIENGEARTC